MWIYCFSFHNFQHKTLDNYLNSNERKIFHCFNVKCLPCHQKCLNKHCLAILGRSWSKIVWLRLSSSSQIFTFIRFPTGQVLFLPLELTLSPVLGDQFFRTWKIFYSLVSCLLLLSFFTFITCYITNVKLLIVSKNILSFNFEEVSPKSIRIKFIFSQIVSYIVDWRHLWVLGPIRLQNLYRCWCWSYLTLGLDSINLGFLFFNVGILGWWLNISEANQYLILTNWIRWFIVFYNIKTLYLVRRIHTKQSYSL